MPFDTSGNFTRVHNWVTDANAGIKIVASRVDEEDDGYATAFNLVFLRDGRAPATGNWKMGTFKITGLGVPTVAGDALSYGSDAGQPSNIDLTHAISLPVAAVTGILPVASGGTGNATGDAVTLGGLARAGFAQLAGANTFAGDLTVNRSSTSSPTTGVLFFGNTGAHYIYHDASNFIFVGPGALSAPTGGFTGNLTGNVTGNVSGNLTGAVTGNADTATRAVSAANADGLADGAGTQVRYDAAFSHWVHSVGGTDIFAVDATNGITLLV